MLLSLGTLVITESKSGATKREYTIIFKYPKIGEDKIILIDKIIFQCLERQGITKENFVFKTSKKLSYSNAEKHLIISKKGNSFKFSILELQQNLKSIPIFKKMDIYKSWLGTIYVNIQFRNPIARILNIDRKHMYLDDSGCVFPTSNKYTFRVLTISHNGFFTKGIKQIECKYCIQNSKKKSKNTFYNKNKHTSSRGYLSKIRMLIPSIFKPILNKSVFARAKESTEFSYNKHTGNCNRKLLKLLLYVSCDKFLREQISHMVIDIGGDIKVYTQISKQVIEFGLPIDFEEKFRKLKILYKQILPAAGWNTYKRVNIEFKNQIVCE